MVVTLDSDRDSNAVADINDTCAFARPDEDPWRLCRQPAKVETRGLVRAVLGPHHRVHRELEVIRRPSEDLLDVIALVVGQSERAMNVALSLRDAHLVTLQARQRFSCEHLSYRERRRGRR